MSEQMTPERLAEIRELFTGFFIALSKQERAAIELLAEVDRLAALAESRLAMVEAERESVNDMERRALSAERERDDACRRNVEHDAEIEEFEATVQRLRGVLEHLADDVRRAKGVADIEEICEWLDGLDQGDIGSPDPAPTPAPGVVASEVDGVGIADQGHDWERTSLNGDGGSGNKFQWACSKCDHREWDVTENGPDADDPNIPPCPGPPAPASPGGDEAERLRKQIAEHRRITGDAVMARTTAEARADVLHQALRGLVEVFERGANDTDYGDEGLLIHECSVDALMPRLDAARAALASNEGSGR